MRTFKDVDSWEKTLKLLKEIMPKGLYNLWKDVNPYGVLDWMGGMDFFEVTDNSYNWIDKDNNNIVYQAGFLNKEIQDNKIVFVAFHLKGDVRGNYTDYFIFDYEDVENLILGFTDEDWKEMGGDVED